MNRCGALLADKISMHQIHYIDTDEEITSVIDRLKKSKASENFFVIPKRATVLQSIVNLKLLKKEAERAKKQITFVTQDQLGKSLAQRTGIALRPDLQGLKSDQKGEEENIIVTAHKKADGEEGNIGQKLIKKNRLENIGSKDFYEEELKKSEKPSQIQVVESGTGKPAVLPIENKKISLLKDVFPRNIEKEKQPAVFEENLGYENKLSPQKEEKLESLFQSEKKNIKAPLAPRVPISAKLKKLFIIFSAVCFTAVAGVLVYLFVPHVKILVSPRYETKEVDLEITGKAGDSEAVAGSFAVPARIIENEKDLTLSYQPTGKSSASSQKARGKVVIFNEYSSSSQPLVATTRLLSSEGKLFRLIKGVTVPGMASVGGESKPGAIEAEVIADEAGPDYNIGTSKFSIPGFEGGSKYDKFYARSEKPMTGGGLDESEAASVSQQDISEAKQKTESALKAQINEDLNQVLAPGEVLLPEAEEQEISESAPLAKAGDVKNSFDYRAKGRISALVFSGDEVKKAIIEALKQKSGNPALADPLAVRIEYRQVSADFQAKTIRIKIRGKVFLMPEINLDQLKKDVLGKSENQVREVLRNYSQIEGVEVNFWPEFFPARIPQYAKQVEIEIQKSEFQE